MTANTKIDFQLREIARVRLEDSPEVFKALVTVFESDTKQGAALRDEFSKLKARRAATVLGMLDLPEDIINFVDAWKTVYSHLGELKVSGSESRPATRPAGLKNPVDDLSIYTLKKLSALSGRTETEILDDVQLGVLRASLLTQAVDADDHTKRQVLKAGYDDVPITVIRPRVVWISHLEAGKLREQGELALSEAEYPIFIDCLPSPPIKRYKKERVIFSEPYTAKLSDLRFLDGDAIQYIAKHTGQELAGPDAVELLPKPQAGGSYVVYTLFAEVPSVEDEKPVAAELTPPSPASRVGTWTLRKPKRFQGYSEPLYQFLESAHAAGKPCPTARDVLIAWLKDCPPEVVEVKPNLSGIVYHSGGARAEKFADVEAITKTIGRMTTAD